MYQQWEESRAGPQVIRKEKQRDAAAADEKENGGIVAERINHKGGGLACAGPDFSVELAAEICCTTVGHGYPVALSCQ